MEKLVFFMFSCAICIFGAVLSNSSAYAKDSESGWQKNDGYTHQSWEFNSLNRNELHDSKNVVGLSGEDTNLTILDNIDDLDNILANLLDPLPVSPGLPGSNIDFLPPDAQINPSDNPFGTAKLLYVFVPEYGGGHHYDDSVFHLDCYGGPGQSSLLFEIPVGENSCLSKDVWVQFTIFSNQSKKTLQSSRVVDVATGYQLTDQLRPYERIKLVNKDMPDSGKKVYLTSFKVSALEEENSGQWYKITAQLKVMGNASVIYVKTDATGPYTLVDSVTVDTKYSDQDTGFNIINLKTGISAEESNRLHKIIGPNWLEDEGYTHQYWMFNALNIGELHCPKLPVDPKDKNPGIPGRTTDYMLPDATDDKAINDYGTAKLIHASVAASIMGMIGHYPPFGEYDRCGIIGGMDDTALVFEIPVNDLCLEKEVWVQYHLFIPGLNDTRLIEVGTGYNSTGVSNDSVDYIQISGQENVSQVYLDLQHLEGKDNMMGKWYRVTGKFIVSDNVPAVYVKVYCVSSGFKSTLIDDVQIDTRCLPSDPQPIIDTIYPPNIVEVNTSFQVIFSEPMDKISTENAFSLQVLDIEDVNKTSAVNGSFKWELNNRKMIFTPSSNLKKNRLLSLVIKNTAKSEKGKYLAQEYINNNFSTGSLPDLSTLFYYLKSAKKDLEFAGNNIYKAKSKKALLNAKYMVSRVMQRLFGDKLIGPMLNMMTDNLSKMEDMGITMDMLPSMMMEMSDMMPTMIGMMPTLLEGMSDAFFSEAELLCCYITIKKALASSYTPFYYHTRYLIRIAEKKMDKLLETEVVKYD